MFAAILFVARSSESRVRQIFLVRGPADPAGLKEIDHRFDTGVKVVLVIGVHAVGASSDSSNIVRLNTFWAI